MIGTIIGYLVGSEYSRSEIKNNICICAQDSIEETICLIAICKTFTETGVIDLIELSEIIKSNIQKYTKLYSKDKDQVLDSVLPDNSSNNNAGIRVSPVAWVATTIEEALLISDCVTATTANCRSEAINDARAITFAIFLARHGTEKDKIRQSIQQRFYPLISCFNNRSQIMHQKLGGGKVALAIIAFLESDSFEGAISNALHMGEDAGMLAAMTGAIAEAYYGVPEELKKAVLLSLDQTFATVIKQFEQKYQTY